MGESDVQQEILQRLTRVETKLDMMASARDIAQEALHSATSANLRLDRVDKVIFWAGTTALGALIVGAVTLLFKFKGV